MHTDASIVATVRRVEEEPSSQLVLGFNPNAYQIIGTDAFPRPATSIMFDWSHTYLQGGFRSPQPCNNKQQHHTPTTQHTIHSPPRHTCHPI